MTILARDEEDIIRHNIEFHLNHGVDFIIATDNASIDNTRNIFLEYQNKGKLFLIDEPGREKLQAEWNNRMTKIAVEEYGADIVFHCDADELWCSRDGNLKNEIWNSNADALKVNIVNVLLEAKDGKESFPEDTKYAVIRPFEPKDYEAESQTDNFYLFKGPAQVIFKTRKGCLEVDQGNHNIMNEGVLCDVSREILIYHFPLRGKERFIKKIIKSGQAIEKNKKLSKGQSFHIKRWYEAYKKGLIDLEYSKLTITRQRAEELINLGMIDKIDFNMLKNNCVQIVRSHLKKLNYNWKYYQPKFEYEQYLQDLAWPWAGHKNFAYDLIANLKPKKIVELGTHYGTSFWSFCQAVKDQKLETELNAVDTWKGDEHAGLYGEEVFETVKKIKDVHYSALKINLIRKTFDEAVGDFENKSIDILHIDGLHTYEAVKNDFEKWLPKMKEDGIILFHDIVVDRSGFGVYKLWQGLKERYKTIEFQHSYGLGVLFLNSSNPFLEIKEKLERHYAWLSEDMKNTKINESLSLAKGQNIQTMIQELQAKDQEIEFMKSSKFWKLREKYLYLKNGLKFVIFSPHKFIKKHFLKK